MPLADVGPSYTANLVTPSRRSCVAVVALVGALTRLWILASPAGVLNSDEAVTGLGAIDALHGRFDVVVPGNAYTANLESYLLAPFVAVFGPRLLLLKLMAIVLWAVGCVVVFLLVRRVAGELAGWVGASMLWLVPGALLELSTHAYLAYPGGLVWVASAMYCLVRLAESAKPTVRLSMFAGLLCGFAVYAHPMYLAVLMPAVVGAGSFHPRSVRLWWLPAAAAALAVNAPFIWWNSRHGFPSLRDDLADNSRGSYWARLSRMFSGLLPRDFGLRNFTGVWTLGLWVSLAIYALLLTGVIAGFIGLMKSGRGGRVLGSAVVAVWPLMAVLSALGYVDDGRYGVVPAVPLFACLGVAGAALARRLRCTCARLTSLGSSAAVVGLWTAVLVAPPLLRFTGDDWGNPNRDFGTIVDRLNAAGIDHIAGNYWAVLPITYMTNGRIPSAVTRPDPVRYPHYQQATEQSPPSIVGFVFRSVNEDPTVLYLEERCYARTIVGEFVVYLPNGVC
jgi:hypothetical protein